LVWASIILQVRSGTLNSTEGAQRLGVWHKTYYEWEDRALKAMALALEIHSPGTSSAPVGAEKEELQKQVRDLERKLYLSEKTTEVKDLLSALDLHEAKKQNEKAIGQEETIRKVVEIIEDIKGKSGMSYGMICRAMKVPLATLGRCRRRKKENRLLINRPGLKNLESFDPSTLDVEIRLLDHGPKRSGGANLRQYIQIPLT